ncbi:uncharacterized protein METZ01_LOCUS94856 [marine metagenome]|uniref:Uncharacterized protein n=1 Tax=marine metagenome TaxID=408172 RepID=A0A381VNZ5_9ZZZZ
MENMYKVAAQLVAILVCGPKKARKLASKPRSPPTNATRTRGDAALHSNTIEGSR